MAADGVPPASDFQFDSTMFWEPIGLARKLAHRTLKCVHLPEKAANQLPFAGTQSNCHWVVESNSIETTELHLASTVRRHITYTGNAKFKCQQSDGTVRLRFTFFEGPWRFAKLGGSKSISQLTWHMNDGNWR